MSTHPIEQLFADGNYAEAERRCRVGLPDAESHNVLGLIFRSRGQLAESIAAHQRAVVLRPDVAPFHNNLAVALTAAGQLPSAVESFRRAISLRPDDAELHYNLANVLLGLGDVAPAIESYAACIRINPTCGEAWCNLSVALRRIGELQQAVQAARRAVELLPNSAEARSNLGMTLAETGELAEAIDHYRLALAVNPTSTATHFNLGNALVQIGDLPGAVEAYDAALALNDQLVGAHCNRANAILRLGDRISARRGYESALKLAPDSADAHWNHGLLLLLEGNYERGWEEHEWRNRLTPPSSLQLPQPLWKGEPLEGKTILLHAEHGLGDTVQFARYVPLVAARGGRVILRVQPALKRLMGTLPGVTELIAEGEPFPRFDVQCPLMSLPIAFGTRIHTIPWNGPYLSADPAPWQPRLGAPSGRLRIGLVWAGSVGHQYDLQRSMQLPMFQPIADLPGVDLISLQKGPATASLPACPFTIRDFTPDLHDFADTAGLIASVDLVITVDTSVAHVAAAMGKPVWVLLAYAPDWRWMVDREYSPWYPTMRLFRQTMRDAWGDVIRYVAAAVSSIAAAK